MQKGARKHIMAKCPHNNGLLYFSKPSNHVLQVRAVLQQYYRNWYSAFMYYAAMGSGDPYHLPLNSWTTFLDDSQVWKCGSVAGGGQGVWIREAAAGTALPRCGMAWGDDRAGQYMSKSETHAYKATAPLPPSSASP